MHRAMAGRMESACIGEEHSAYGDDFGIPLLSFRELSDLQEQTNWQIQFLSRLLYALAQEPDVRKLREIRILRHPGEIADYIFNHVADFILLTYAEFLPVVLKRKDSGWVVDKDDFADWMIVNWRTGMLVIDVS